MFARGGVRAMFLGRFHLKAIFGSKICKMNFTFFEDKNFLQLPFFLSLILKIAPCLIKFITKIKLSPIYLGRRYAGSQYFGEENFQ